MKRTYVCLGLTFALAMLSSPRFIVAQVDGAGADDRRRPADGANQDGVAPGADAAEDSPDKSPSQLQEPAEQEGASSREATRFVQLQRAMKKRLDLSGEQEKAIDLLFGERLAALKERRGQRNQAADGSEHAETLKALHDQINEARKAGDKEKVRELRDQLREKLRASFAASEEAASTFMDKLASELNENQRPQFWRLARHFGIGYPSANRGAGLRELWRAVTSPEVALSQEQRRAVGRILRDASRSLADSGRDPKMIDETNDRIRADVLKELTPEQRIKVEAALSTDQSREPGHARSETTEPERLRPDVHTDPDADRDAETPPQMADDEDSPDDDGD